MTQFAPARKPWIDALRALAILFVMYGHMVQGETAFFVFTSPIKIPLFFALTGYLFKDPEGSIKAFLGKLLRTLVVPWLFLSCLPVIAFSAVFGLNYLITELLKIFTGESVWYMPCCIVAEILWFFMRRYLKKPWQLTCGACICFAAGLLLGKFQILDFFMINRALVAQLFLLAGYFIKYFEEKIAKLNWRWLLLSCVAYVGLCVVSLLVFPTGVLDVHKNVYYHLPLCLLLIGLGLFTCFAIASRISRAPAFLTFIGKNTLVFYIWSGYAVWAINKALQIAGIHLESLLMMIAHTAMQCAICGIAALLLNRFLPGAVGKRRQRVSLDKKVGSV